jgi:inner membrane protein
MDSLTHIVLGAAIGEAVLGKKIGRKAMLWGALADTIPDFDVFAACCTTDAQQLLVHRGFTHSLLFVVLMSPLLGWLFSKWFKKSAVSWQRWTLLFFLGLFTHILLDACTAYGTGWFEPFNSYRVSFNTIFVADPFYTLPFLICMIVALIAKNESQRRINWTKAGLVISSIYLLFTFINKWQVTTKMKNNLTAKNIITNDFVTTPTALNNFLWMAYAPDTSGYWIGYYSVFDKRKDINFYKVEKNDLLLKPYENEKSVKQLKQFSKGYYTLSKNGTNVYFNDIRFGQLGGWEGSDSTFVFSFRLSSTEESQQSLNRTKFKTSLKDAFYGLIKRIKGLD